MESEALSSLVVEIVEESVRSAVLDLHTSMPGIIVKYDPGTQKADVQPVLKRKYVDEMLSQPLPIIPNVPVLMPRSRLAFISLPLAPGDYVLLVFSERSIDTWLNLGGVSDPEDSRTHALSDAVAIPGVYPFTEAFQGGSATDLVMANALSKVTMKPTGDVEILAGDTAGIAIKVTGEIEIANTLSTVTVKPTGDVEIAVGEAALIALKASGDVDFKAGLSEGKMQASGGVKFSNAGGSFELSPSGQFKIGNVAGNDLVQIMIDLVTAISSSVVFTAIGPQPLIDPALGPAKWVDALTKLNTLKG